MSRAIFWIGLVVVIVFAVRAKLRAAAVRRAAHEAPPAQAGAIEDMRRCAHCGLHFPASEAVQADGRDYCSPAHVRLPPR